MNTCLRFPGGRDRALTLSYDDGVTSDIPLLEILNAHGIRATFQNASHLLHHLFGTKEGRIHHHDLHAGYCVEGPGHRIMLIAGDDNSAARTDQSVDGDVQAVGGVGGDDHLFRRIYTKQGRRFITAAKSRFFRHT